MQSPPSNILSFTDARFVVRVVPTSDMLKTVSFKLKKFQAEDFPFLAGVLLFQCPMSVLRFSNSITMLWRDLKVLQVYGANTEVGKSIVSTLLCKAFKRKSPTSGVLYLKPVSTGPLEDADTKYVILTIQV